MDLPSQIEVLFFISIALVAQSCAGIGNEGPTSEVRSSKCLSPPAPSSPNEPLRISGLPLGDRPIFADFCNTTYHALSAYSTQIILKNIRKNYQEKDVKYGNLPAILSEAGIKIPDQFDTTWKWHLGDKLKRYLVDLVRKQIPYIYFKLNNLSVIDESRNKQTCLGMDVFGRNVILSDVMDLYTENVHRETNCTICRFCNWELRILATEKFYIDRDVEGQFAKNDIERLKYMSVVAPVWEVQAEPGETRTIKLDGDRTSMEGGSFIGAYSAITDASKLFISASGADGKPENVGGNSGSIHLVNTSGKVTVHAKACPGSGKYDGKFTESLYVPGHVVNDIHTGMLTGSIFDCFSTHFDDFFIRLHSLVNFTIAPLSLAKELETIEQAFYARGNYIKNCPWKIKRRLEKYYEKTLEMTKKQLENPVPADRQALGIIGSSTLSKLISRRKLDRTANGISTMNYLENVAEELKWLKRTFDSTNIAEIVKFKMAVMKEIESSKTMMEENVGDAKTFINKTLSPAMRMAEDMMNSTSAKLLKILKTFFEANDDDLETLEQMKKDFDNLLPFKYVYSGLQIVAAVINFFGPSGASPPVGNLIPGGSILVAFVKSERLGSHPSTSFNKAKREESREYHQNSPPTEDNDSDYLSLIPEIRDAVEDIVGKIKSNNLKRDQLELAILESKPKIKSIMVFINQFHNTFIPALNEMARDIRKELSSIKGTSLSLLAVKNWDIRSVLSNMRRFLKYFSEWISDAQMVMVKQGGKVSGESRVLESLHYTFDILSETLERIFELYGHIDIYQEWNELADFIVHIDSPIIDEDLEDVVLEPLFLSFITNLLLEKHNKALFAFKQWAFPFAKLYLDDYYYDYDLILKITPNTTFRRNFESCETVIYRFGIALKKIQVPSPVSKFQYETDFTISRTSEPYYVWTNEKWQHAIYRLFQGEEIRLKADVDMLGHDEATKSFFRGMNAIKFTSIQLFIKAHDENQQEELNNALSFFQMSIIHSGLSIYKVDGQQYVMRNKAQEYLYNFEGNGKAWPYSDFLLSPYTWWTFRIYKSRAEFEILQRFANKVDLVLQGSGVVLNDRWINKDDPAFLNDLNIAEYYELYQPNNDELLNVGEIPTDSVQRRCGWGRTQTANNLNLPFSGPGQQSCYHKLKCDEGKGVVTITGKFVLVSDPDNNDFEEYLKATRYSEDSRTEIRNSKMVNVSIDMLNSTTYHVEWFIDDKKLSVSFEPGNEFKTLLSDGQEVSNIINVNTEHNSVMHIIKFMDFEATNELIFCYWGFKATLKAKNAEAVLTFKRL